MTTKLEQPKLEMEEHCPSYGRDYNPGYIGFTYTNKHIIAKGIAYFTRWANMTDIRATHALIVTGKNQCVEADASKNCVTEGTLQHYFDNPHCQIFFRKPKGLNKTIADKMVKLAKEKVGEQYDFASILTHAISGSFAGRCLHHLLRGEFENELSKILNSPKKWICSELVAYVLDEQDEYRDQGILEQPNATISPQELFEDSVIFEPWKNGINLKPLVIN